MGQQPVKRKIRKPFVSIVVPALNEEITIGEFIEWCKAGLKQAGVKGEIIIIDSSTDKTSKIAVQHGVKVLCMPRRGLGQAYIDALPHIRGDYVIMGDCDLTYDFRDIKDFIAKLNEGYDFVMGTRMKGHIESNAMPALHRYFGTPLTTMIMNIIYGSHYSDIHCGMRALRIEALRKLNLESSSWEYASEMVLKAARMKLKTTEIPIKFYKDREGRASHHKRMGWFSPWYAGWLNLKVMFMYCPKFFLKIPGLMSILAGLFLVVTLIGGSLQVGILSFSVHGMLLGLALIVLGYSSLQMGLLSEVVYDMDPQRSRKYKKLFTYNKGTLVGFVMILIGLVLLGVFINDYIKYGFALKEMSKTAILGLLTLILGFQTFTFTLVFQMIVNKNAATQKKEAQNGFHQSGPG